MAYELETSNISDEGGFSIQGIGSHDHRPELVGLGAKEMLQALRNLQAENERILHNEELQGKILQNLIQLQNQVHPISVSLLKVEEGEPLKGGPSGRHQHSRSRTASRAGKHTHVKSTEMCHRKEVHVLDFSLIFRSVSLLNLSSHSLTVY